MFLMAILLTILIKYIQVERTFIPHGRIITSLVLKQLSGLLLLLQMKKNLIKM
jgi:hypothetical protein